MVINPSLEKSNLLWQFLVKSKQHLKASRVLVGLAEAKSAEIPLAKRVEYLSLAVSNAKSSGPSGDAGTLLTYIQDRLEVAQVQLEIMRTIEKQQADGKIDATAARDSLAALNSELYDVTELYKDFASKFGLHDAVLALLHVSKSAAQDLVTETWISILKDADNEGRASGTPPSDPRFVSERVQTLGMRFYPDENVFPLCEFRGWSRGKIVETLLDLSPLTFQMPSARAWKTMARDTMSPTRLGSSDSCATLVCRSESCLKNTT